jgi:hypothetical protein
MLHGFEIRENVVDTAAKSGVLPTYPPVGGLSSTDDMSTDLKLVTKNLWHSCGRSTLDDW